MYLPNLFFNPFSILNGIIQKTTILPLQVFKVQVSQSMLVTPELGNPESQVPEHSWEYHPIYHWRIRILSWNVARGEANVIILFSNLFSQLLDCVTRWYQVWGHFFIVKNVKVIDPFPNMSSYYRPKDCTHRENANWEMDLNFHICKMGISA